MATVKGSGEDIDDASTSFQQLLDHVRREYGRGTMRGQEADGQESEWRSTDGGAVPAIERVESENEEELPEDELPSLFDRILRRGKLYPEPADARETEDQ